MDGRTDLLVDILLGKYSDPSLGVDARGGQVFTTMLRINYLPVFGIIMLQVLFSWEEKRMEFKGILHPLVQFPSHSSTRMVHPTIPLWTLHCLVLVWCVFGSGQLLVSTTNLILL